MGRIWSWIVIKRSEKNPYIKIPKDVLSNLEGRYPKPLYVLVFEDGNDLERTMECIMSKEGGEEG